MRIAGHIFLAAILLSAFILIGYVIGGTIAEEMAERNYVSVKRSLAIDYRANWNDDTDRADTSIWIGTWKITYTDSVIQNDNLWVSVTYKSSGWLREKISEEREKLQATGRNTSWIKNKNFENSFNQDPIHIEKQSLISNIFSNSEIFVSLTRSPNIEEKHIFDNSRIYSHGFETHLWSWDSGLPGNKMIAIKVGGHIDNTEPEIIVRKHSDGEVNTTKNANFIQLPVEVLSEFGISAQTVSLIKGLGAFIGFVASFPILRTILAEIRKTLYKKTTLS